MQDATRTTVDARTHGDQPVAVEIIRGRRFALRCPLAPRRLLTLRCPCGLVVWTLVVLAAVGPIARAGDTPSASASAGDASLSPGRSSNALVEPVIVRIHPTAVVTGDEVSLADVAEVGGEAGRLAAEWRVISAPRPGENLTIESTQIQQVLTNRGANVSAWLFRGAMRCEIRRPGAPQRNPSSCTVAATEAGSATREAASPSDQLRVNPEITLEDCLRAHAVRQVANLGGEPMVQFSPAASKYLALAKPIYRFVIQQRGERLLGLVALEATIYEGETVKQVIPIVAQVSLRKRVVAAARPINRGQTIEARDLQLVERTFERLDEIGLADPAPVVGQRAKQFIQENALLTVGDVEPVPLVSRNDLVTVWVRRGGVVIRGVAKAMGSAGYGQAIELKSEMSRQVFVGVVTGPRTVEVPAVTADAPEPAMLAEGGQR